MTVNPTAASSTALTKSARFHDPDLVHGLILPMTATIRAALNVLEKSGKGIVFVTETDGRLAGIATDGDLRRSLLRGLVLDASVAACMNRDFRRVSVTSGRQAILKAMDYRVKCVPILDEDGHLFDFVTFDQVYSMPVAEPHLVGRELEYVTDCIRTNWISSQGAYVRRFEEQFRNLIDTKYAITCSSGTTALHLALAALGVGSGDEVIVPDLTFIATANAVKYCGGTVVLVDVDTATWTMAPAAVEAAVTPKTKGILVVHLYGHPANMIELSRIARDHRLFMVEDCAEALGAQVAYRTVGNFGDIGCFSFYGNKTVTTGEGGMLVTNNPDLADKARLLRDHGMSREKRYWHPEVGFNYRLTNLQAAVGVAQLERLDAIQNNKREIDRLYREHLRDIPGLVMPPAASWAQPVCWLFSLLVEPEQAGCSRDEIIRHMETSNIGCRPFFSPLHIQPPYRTEGAFSSSDALSQKGLSLPSVVGLGERDIEYITHVLRRFVSARTGKPV